MHQQAWSQGTRVTIGSLSAERVANTASDFKPRPLIVRLSPVELKRNILKNAHKLTNFYDNRSPLKFSYPTIVPKSNRRRINSCARGYVSEGKRRKRIHQTCEHFLSNASIRTEITHICWSVIPTSITS